MGSEPQRVEAPRRQPGAAGRFARPQGEYACLLTGKDDGSPRLRASLPRAGGTRAVLSRQRCLNRKLSRLHPSGDQPRPGLQVGPPSTGAETQAWQSVFTPRNKKPTSSWESRCLPLHPRAYPMLGIYLPPNPFSFFPSCSLLLSLVHFCSASFQAEFEMTH